jgi:Conjugal transfer protein TrbL
VRCRILLAVALAATIAGSLISRCTADPDPAHPAAVPPGKAIVSPPWVRTSTAASVLTPVEEGAATPALAAPFRSSDVLASFSSSPIPPGQADAPPPLQPPVPPIPLPDLPNPFDSLDALDPRTLATDLVTALLTTFGEALIGAMRGFTDWALGLGDSSLNFVTRTPAAGTYASPTVRSLWDYSRAITNAALAVIVLCGGLNVMVKEHTRSPYHEALELLPRLLLGALAANLSLSFARFLIDLNNAVAGGVGQVGLPCYDQATPSQEGVALIVTALAYAVVAILLVLQMLMRLALLDLLIILSPLAMLLWVLPQTQGWFRWWIDLFPITVFQQALQVLTLKLGTALMVELTPGSLSNATLTLFLGIAVCWLTLKLPTLLHRASHRAGLGSAVSLILISRAASGLGLVSRTGGAAGTAGASIATGGRGGGPRPTLQRGTP